MNTPAISTSTASSRWWRKRSACAGESEFVTISYWESVEAMSRFAGDDPRRIHHLERDAEFLIELPSGVQVLDIVASHGDTGGDSSR